MKPSAAVAFSGGGALGVAHLGAWEVIAKRFAISSVAGTSAGAIVAAFCGTGYGPDYTTEIFRQMNLSKLTGWRISSRGLSDGRKFEKWLFNKLASRFSDLPPQNLTFKEARRQKGPELAIIACDLNKPSQPVIFSSNNESDTLIAFAVRASVSVPVYFKPVLRPDKGQVLVDGGILLNFPVSLLRGAIEQSIPVIGVHFHDAQEFLNDPKTWKMPRATLSALMTHSNAIPSEIEQYPHYISIEINKEGYNWLNFNLSERDKDALLHLGREAAEKALLKYDNKLLYMKASDNMPDPVLVGQPFPEEPQPNELISALPSVSPMAQDASRILRDPRTLEQRINDTFSGNALISFCQSRFRSVADELMPDMSKERMIQLLIDHCRYFDCGAELLDQLEQVRPGLIGADRDILLHQLFGSD